jgi:hypothetical protein
MKARVNAMGVILVVLDDFYESVAMPCQVKYRVGVCCQSRFFINSFFYLHALMSHPYLM